MIHQELRVTPYVKSHPPKKKEKASQQSCRDAETVKKIRAQTVGHLQRISPGREGLTGS